MMRLVTALAGLGLNLVAGQIIKTVAPLDCSDTGFDSWQVGTNRVDATTNGFSVTPLDFSNGAVGRTITLQTTVPPDGAKQRAVVSLDACGVSPTSNKMYCSAAVDEDTAVAAKTGWTYYLVRIDPRAGVDNAIGFCAKYDMTGLTVANDNTPTAGDFKFVKATSTTNAHGVYYAALDGNTNLWSFTDPDKLDCYLNPDDATGTISAGQTLTEEITDDFVVWDNYLVGIQKTSGLAKADAVIQPGAAAWNIGTPSPQLPNDGGGREPFVSTWIHQGELIVFYSDKNDNGDPANGNDAGFTSITLTTGATNPPAHHRYMGFDIHGNVDDDRATPGLARADGAYCLKTKCTCTSGEPETNSYCPVMAPEKCSVCNAGFILQGDRCIKNNICTCLNGVAATGDKCGAHDLHSCIDCDHGYTLTTSAISAEMVCAPHQCTCPNGTPMTGETCSGHGAEECNTCNDFYHKERKECVANTCSCSNGEPEIDACEEHMQEQCNSCDTGYTLKQKQCVQTA